jgi:hypothetical protein
MARARDIANIINSGTFLTEYPLTKNFQVLNSGASSYSIDGGSNPTITLVRGQTYYFTVNAPGHPFWIQTTGGGYNSSNVYNTGITNAGIDSGVIKFTVDASTPDTLYYQCEYHVAMSGTIIVTNYLPETSASATYLPLRGGSVSGNLSVSGNIINSARPMFDAYGTGGQAWSGTATRKIVQLSQTYSNIGSHFNTSTYKFTVPINGTYLFNARAATSTPTATGPALLIDIDNGSFAPEVGINYSNINYTTFTGSLITTLTQGQTVQLSINNYNNTSFTIDQGRCALSGVFLG